jgi:hypothetical protein
MSNKNLVFFSRCKPHNSDPIDLVLENNRVFIGYPAFRQDVVAQPGHLKEAVIDPGCPPEEWAGLKPNFGKDRRQYQQNRNLFQKIKRGAIALVPRLDRGVVYAGRVIAPFEVLDDPAWGQDYLALHHLQLDDKEACDHLANVAQCCKVDRFREIRFPLIPAWIRRSLFGRSTYGFIADIPDHDPYVALDRLIDHPERRKPSWTRDAREVENRLLDGIGPTAFEHLCVDLLQLECRQDTWIHVGGSGDGGVDGMGFGPDGRVNGMLQCKWAYRDEDITIADPEIRGSVREILAALIHPAAPKHTAGIEFWSREHVASLVLKHAESLPVAMSLRIGPKRIAHMVA